MGRAGGNRGRLGRSGHGAGRRFLFHLIMLGACLALVWSAGLFAFAETIPHTPDEAAHRTDAIVVLTGGTGRVGEGLDLLAADKAERLFVSGVYKGVDVKDLIQTFRHNPSANTGRIEIGEAEDTIANARETAAWVRAHGYRSLRLVTGAYHMPRSLLEFRRALPGTDIVAHPVFPAHVKHDDWWAWPGTAALVITEYNKFLLAWLRHLALTVLAGTALERDGS